MMRTTAMRTTAFFLGLSLLQGACTTAHPTAQRINAGQILEGWIVFSREFQLYERRQDVGRKYDQSCYSGIFDTLRNHGAAARFDRRRVRIVGSLVSATAYFGETGLSTRAENYCARDAILIARTIIALD